MAAATPTREPSQIAAGDTATWQISLGDFPASDGWVLSYVLLKHGGGLKIQISSSASGDEHLVNVTAAETSTWLDGDYDWNAYVTLADERHQVGFGRLTITPNFASAEDGYDVRSVARKIFDALEAAILKLSQAQETAGKGSITSWSAEGLSITRSSPDQLFAALVQQRDRYKTIVQREERLATGKGRGGKILIRFTEP